MKFITFEKDGRISVGTVQDNQVIDLGGRLGEGVYSLDALLQQGRLEEAMALAQSLPPLCPVEQVKLLKPLLSPGKIICVGVNYANRNAEYQDESELPKYPSIFMRTPGSFVAQGENLVRPPESEQLDYEGEIVVIIGKAGRRIPEEHARDHIAGLTIMNEATLRDWVRHAKFNVTQGKNFERLGAYGPWMVTSDQFEDLGALHLQTRVNGEIRQDDTTANMMFPIPYLIHYISTFAQLEPGDMIATGTPTGAGARLDPPRYLIPGDVVEVTVDGIGCLKNGVEDERL
ncbi:fumarylacetoacetate hydrolase family protein [Luteithermobacter gelatinilyticus]|uniref:fumarylacetoacetate hydrolase family protein n=1 Tax=Luteithermobacter gelatinilyticus TaxID=2582913 RepID=UPI0011060142|nr:fumarylacetoacetate hydrolase family protein [Luteithermobacter gelatinilyticus]